MLYVEQPPVFAGSVKNYGTSYPNRVNALRDIKRIVDPMVSDYVFAKKLIDVPLDERYDYIERIVGNYKNTRSIRKSVVDRLEKNLKVLRKEESK